MKNMVEKGENKGGQDEERTEEGEVVVQPQRGEAPDVIKAHLRSA